VIQSQIHLRNGEGELVEPAAEGTVFVEDALEFGGDGGDAFFGVGLEAGTARCRRRGVRASLHALVDGQAVKTPAGGEKRSPMAKPLISPFTLSLARVPQTFGTSSGMRTMTQPRFEGMRSSVALKDFATGLGFGFMEPNERVKNQKRARQERALFFSEKT